MANWWNKAVGEMSKLRDNVMGRFGISIGSTGSGYKLDSSRVDYEMAKQLYYNTNDDYKLGAGFAKSIINNTVSFMGVPQFRVVDKDAQEILDVFFKNNISNIQRTERDSLRDGDCFVWITREEEEDAALYPEQSTRLVYNIIPPGQVKDILRHPLTGAIYEYKLVSSHEWEDERGDKKKATITQRIRKGERIIEIDGDNPPDVTPGTEPTPWDFIPIVHFKNEGDESLFGQSDIEPIEPFLKAYHDVMLHAMQGSKMHSTPRLKLKIKEVTTFLKNNFGVTDPVKFAKDGGTIKLDGHELLLLASEDEAEFIEVKSAIGDAKELLKFLFYCIVDTSETPEFVFGVHTPSSLSSVKEQMPILIRSIERKREHFADSWKRLARIVLAMTAQSENTAIGTYSTDLKWTNIDPRTSKEISEELLNVVNAMKAALEVNVISDESAVNFLSKFVDTMCKYEEEEGEGERERILKSLIAKTKMPDSAELEKELLELTKKISSGAA
ncbi:phage portal protein [Lysinibacillus sp. Bpr_S20]|uniref:phage portal protein n=1 Tax=Lysinibacillus sp. Bpr_S20 TaxID=2933964 RepID=UPI0020112078|nr:phage portal protein [Lysinibacillus sp. Bpr_S20]MCL1701614.1 phage portal protein [Lysinibacillus sp. Bpr_S20]